MLPVLSGEGQFGAGSTLVAGYEIVVAVRSNLFLVLFHLKFQYRAALQTERADFEMVANAAVGAGPDSGPAGESLDCSQTRGHDVMIATTSVSKCQHYAPGTLRPERHPQVPCG